MYYLLSGDSTVLDEMIRNISHLTELAVDCLVQTCAKLGWEEYEPRKLSTRRSPKAPRLLPKSQGRFGSVALPL